MVQPTYKVWCTTQDGPQGINLAELRCSQHITHLQLNVHLVSAATTSLTSPFPTRTLQGPAQLQWKMGGVVALCH
jgi:hypothetical protein